MHLRIKNRTWAADLVEIGSLSFFNCGVKYLLCVIDIFTKYAWVKPLADKKAKTALDGFFGIVNESKRKPNKLEADQRKQFYYTIMQKWLDNNDLTYKVLDL